MGAKVSNVLPIIHCEVADLKIARADVVEDGVSEYVPLPILRRRCAGRRRR